MSNLAEMIAKAKEQAAAVANLPAVANTNTSLAVTNAPRDLNNEQFYTRGGMDCETYLQVKDAGIKLSKEWTGYIDGFDAYLDMTEVQNFMGIRKEVGTTVTYAKSYDEVRTTRGEDWLQIVADFQATSQKPAAPYPGSDIPLVLLNDTTSPKKDDKMYPAGTVVGFSTSITGFKRFAAFAKKVHRQGLGAETLKVRVTCKPEKNGAGQTWGTCEFELIGLASDDSVAEAA